MSFQFTKISGSCFSFTNSAWLNCAEIAYNSGWKPKGTVLADDIAESLAESSCIGIPFWRYTFWFSTNDFSPVGRMLSHKHRFTDDEIEDIQRNPKKQWDMSDDIFTSYVKPYECVKVDVTHPQSGRMVTAEEVKKEWSGDYFVCGGQVIVAEDSNNLSKSLKVAISQNESLSYLEKAADFFSQGAVCIT